MQNWRQTPSFRRKKSSSFFFLTEKYVAYCCVVRWINITSFCAKRALWHFGRIIWFQVSFMDYLSVTKLSSQKKKNDDVAHDILCWTNPDNSTISCKYWPKVNEQHNKNIILQSVYIDKIILYYCSCIYLCGQHNTNTTTFEQPSNVKYWYITRSVENLYGQWMHSTHLLAI